ncbi:hypothetical protein ACVWXU_000557 [Streptomyces sp. TE33382]
MTPVLDIFIRSYHRDRHWLALALRSIALFASGHRQVVVVVPRSSLERMEPSAIESAGVRLYTCRDYADDYLGQQITKLNADRYTDADTILHLDSDQVFTAPCELTARLFDHGRPRMAFDSGGDRPESDGWRQCPTAFFGEPVRPDLTEPPPLVVPRHVYARIRAHCWDAHGRSISSYAHAAGFGAFCEFALLRGFALGVRCSSCSVCRTGRPPRRSAAASTSSTRWPWSWMTPASTTACWPISATVSPKMTAPTDSSTSR